MSIETAEELAALRRAGAVVAEALEAMQASVASGISTAELDAIAAKVLREHGAQSAPQMLYDFPGSACISVNEQAVHGVPGDRVLRDGDLVTLDVTVELDGFYADAARTVGVGPVSDLAQRLIRCGERAFWSGARAARAGERLATIGGRVESEVERNGFSVLRELCGHGIGRSIHEEPEILNFYDPEGRTRLTAGLVLALEPIVSVAPTRVRTEADGWTLSSVDGSLTAHHENTIVITRGRPLILTRLSDES